MAQPSIKQLDAFWWAATSANFVTAAERLNLSVSSLSKRISGLESLLGETLFDPWKVSVIRLPPSGISDSARRATSMKLKQDMFSEFRTKSMRLRT